MVLVLSPLYKTRKKKNFPSSKEDVTLPESFVREAVGAEAFYRRFPLAYGPNGKVRSGQVRLD